MAADPSSSRRPLPDDDVSSLLRDAYQSESPTTEFAASLGQRLEEELDSVLAAGSPPHPSGEIERVTAAAKSPGRRRPWRRTGRSAWVLAVAGLVVLAVTIWSSQPSYSWTSMLRALERQPWIESAADPADGDEAGQDRQAWFSEPNRLIVVRQGSDVVWNDLRNRLQQRYQSASRRLSRQSLNADESRSIETALLAFLLSGADPPSVSEGDESTSADGLAVLSESWRYVGAGENRVVQLDVVLSTGADDASTIHLWLELDPRTRLPRTCQLIEDADHVAATVHFAYPETGPQDLSDVGVPRDVVVQESATSNGGVQVAVADRHELDVSDTGTPPEFADDRPAATNLNTPSSLPDEPSLHDDDFETPSPPPSVPRSSGEMSRRIDALLAASWDHHGIVPAEPCDDEEFVRRVYLDLTGRIPTVSECREFDADAGPDRRERLIDRLLSCRDHATHLGAVWRRILLPDGVDLSVYGGSGSLEEWLADRFRVNEPYDALVRELLLAEGRVSEAGPMLFYTALKLAPEEIAARTSRAFLGVRLECAQCHDHLFDKRWKQTDFWGYAAFFAQISRPEGKMDVVSPVLRIADADHGEVTLPDSDDVIAPRYPLGASAADDPNASSRRERLAQWMTAVDNPYFARATVNRVWAHLFGRGLVEPVDDMRIDNPPDCPDLLDELAGYFVASGFNLRDLFRVIVASQAYQRTSQSQDDDPSRTLHFAQMNVKTLTAEQLYDSIAVATRLEPVESDDGSLVRFANVGRQAFLEQFRAPPGQVIDYQAGIPQALTLMNGGLIQSATDLQSSGILRSLEAPFFSDEQRIETLFLATLSRRPDDVERTEMFDYVRAADGERAERLSDVLWALLNSAEMTLNH